jgi:hypothetical protein
MKEFSFLPKKVRKIHFDFFFARTKIYIGWGEVSIDLSPHHSKKKIFFPPLRFSFSPPEFPFIPLKKKFGKCEPKF